MSASKGMISVALRGFVYGLFATLISMSVVMGIGGRTGWVISRLLLGGLIGSVGGITRGSIRNALYGVGGGIVGASVAEGITAALSGGIGWAATRVISWMILGGLIGCAFGLGEGLALRKGLFGAAGGMIGGGIDWATAGATVTEVKWIIVGTIGWMTIGALTGAGWGLSKGSKRKAVYGVLAGILGAAVAKPLFEAAVGLIASLIGMWKGSLMEGGVCGMSIWVFITFVELLHLYKW